MFDFLNNMFKKNKKYVPKKNERWQYASDGVTKIPMKEE